MMDDKEQDEVVAKRMAAAAQAKVDAIQMAKDCLAKGGEFAFQKKWLAQYARILPEQLLGGDIEQIRTLVRETESKAAHRLYAMKQAPAAAECADWTDDYVADCVSYLTGRDDDRASDRNRSGWTRSDSSVGHMICAVLHAGNSDDRPAVLNAARGMLGKYHRHLSMMSVGQGEAA